MPQEDRQPQESQAQNIQESPIQNESPAKAIAPGIDDELDAALEKAFNQQPKEEPKKEVAKEDPKVESEKKPKEEVKTQNEEKKVVETKEIDELSEKAPKDQAAWTALKNKTKASHKMIVERDEEISRLKKTVAEKGDNSSKELEKLKSEIDELTKFRSMVDLQADPKFIQEYEEPITKVEQSIRSMLKEIDNTVTEDQLDKMDFSDTSLMDQVIKHISENKDNFKARKLQNKIDEYLSLEEKKEEALKGHKNNYKEYLENKKKESFNKQSEDEGVALRHIEELSQAKNKEEKPLYPFLSKQEIPENADELTRNKGNVHNSMVDAMQARLQSYLSLSSPKERVDLAVAAVGAHYLNAQLKASIKEVNSLKDEIKRISNVTEEKGDPKPKRSAPSKEMDVDSALNEFFANK